MADWQAVLRSTTMGDGTPYLIDVERGGVQGFWDAEAKVAETDYAHVDGSFIPESLEAARTVTVALLIVGDTLAAVGSGLSTMRTVWKPGASTDERLDVTIPGFGAAYVMGWPLGIVADTSRMSALEIPALGTFRVTDPTIHT